MTLVRALAALLCFSSASWAGPSVEVAPERPSPGEVFSVRVVGAGAGGPLEVAFDDNRFPLWPADGGWEGLAAVDRDAKPGPRPLRVLPSGADGGTWVAALEVSVGKRSYPEQRLTVSERLVTLSPEDQARAGREAALIRDALDRRSSRRLWAKAFRIPVDGPISSAFGVRRIYNGKPKSYHSGLDIAAPRGTPVGAAGAGAVALVGDFFYTGNTVFLDHGLGLYTAYFHLDSVAVGEGEVLEEGAVVGKVGSTGRSTGAHLHWGVYLSGVKADPLTLVRASGGASGGGESP